MKSRLHILLLWLYRASRHGPGAAPVGMAGWRTSGKLPVSLASSQIGDASHARLTARSYPVRLALLASRGTLKNRRSKLFAFKQEVVPGTPCVRRRAVTRWRQSSLQAAQLQAEAPPFIMDVFEGAHLRSFFTLFAYSCMLHVLTDMCSRRTHRLWSSIINSVEETA